MSAVTNSAATSPLSAALDAYRVAVRNTAYAETHGTHGDGQPEARKREEIAARREVFRAARLSH